jgi:protein-tyrosine phosphatase
MVDLHTHILPGIDDGAKDWDESLWMLSLAEEDGITDIMATPHQHADGPYTNHNAKVQSLVSELKERAATAGLNINVHAGGEVLISPDVVERVAAGQAATFGQGKYLLLELPAQEVPTYTRQVVYDLQLHGIIPVLAHVERNAGFRIAPELLAELVEVGALAQMTASSLSHHGSPEVLEMAALCLTHNLVHLLASDAHSPVRRPPLIGHYTQRFEEVWDKAQVQELITHTPAALVAGQYVYVPDVVPITRQSRKEAARLAQALRHASDESKQRGGVLARLMRQIRKTP